MLNDRLKGSLTPSSQLHPTISVLVPNYNYAGFIGRALAALAAQSKAADEIIVVDDASTDDSCSVVESFAESLPQLRLIRNAQNLGVNATLNRALAEARGRYVLCTASDDWLLPAFIERMTAAISRLPQVRLCVSAYVQYHEVDNRIVRYDASSDLGPWFATEGVRYFSAAECRALLARRFIWLPMNTALVEREALLDVGGYDPDLQWHADWFAAYAIALRFGFAIVPEPLSIFRIAPTTYSGLGMRDKQRQRQVCNAILDKLGDPEFHDIRGNLQKAPAAFSPFLRQLAQVLIARPSWWPYLFPLAAWWLNEAAHLRRPRVLRDLAARVKFYRGVKDEG
jgi:glycosyltransferase involved in cell wall biosynthesis